MNSQNQLARPLAVPVDADAVDSPIVHFGPLWQTAIHFATQDGRWGRVTFERLDSIRMSRGEYKPFPLYPDGLGIDSWVSTVSSSEWLKERYQYEKRYYAADYEFGGHVDEMLQEYDHYLFQFHDEFVEAIAAGIWLEVDDEMLGNRELDVPHPLKGLEHLDPVEHFESSGIRCFVRRNPMSKEDLHCAAGLCSQTLIEIGAELDGRASSSWSLTYRVRNGMGRSYLRGHFGNAAESYDGVASLSQIRPHIDQWLSEVRERRRDLGK